MIDDESGESMEPMEEVPLRTAGSRVTNDLSINEART